jgi:hypothetical protein
MGYSGKEFQEITENRLPDPIADAFKILSSEIEDIEKRLVDVERLQGIHHAELDRIVEEKKKEIMSIFSQNEDFSMGAGI